jgi:hypothetical protein
MNPVVRRKPSLLCFTKAPPVAIPTFLQFGIYLFYQILALVFLIIQDKSSGKDSKAHLKSQGAKAVEAKNYATALKFYTEVYCCAVILKSVVTEKRLKITLIFCTANTSLVVNISWEEKILTTLPTFVLTSIQ